MLLAIGGAAQLLTDYDTPNSMVHVPEFSKHPLRPIERLIRARPDLRPQTEAMLIRAVVVSRDYSLDSLFLTIATDIDRSGDTARRIIALLPQDYYYDKTIKWANYDCQQFGFSDCAVLHR